MIFQVFFRHVFDHCQFNKGVVEGVTYNPCIVSHCISLPTLKPWAGLCFSCFCGCMRASHHHMRSLHLSKSCVVPNINRYQCQHVHRPQKPHSFLLVVR